MSSGASTYVELATLAAWLGGVAPAIPATVYLALFSVAPGPGNGSGTELSGNGYARASVTNNQTNWPAPSGSAPASVSNGTVINFPTATGNWSQAVAFAVYDSATGGNELFYGLLGTPVTITTGNTFSFPIGSITGQMT